jgi:hypothetical protein
MSKKDLDDPNVEIITQDNGSLDLGYGAVPPDYSSISYSGYGTDTITLDSSTMYSSNTITLPSTTITNGGYTIGSAGSSGQFYTTTGTGHYNWNNVTTTSPGVNITGTGIDMAAGTDITVGGKSLKEFMSNVEDRLNILHPNPALEDRWEQLKELRRQYVEMEKDLLEKEKIMKILKEA